MSRTHEAELSRRDFMRSMLLWVGGFVGALVAAPSLAFLMSPAFDRAEGSTWADLGGLRDFPQNAPAFREITRATVNGWERSGKTYGIFVVRQGETAVRAFSNICTHLGCHVSWRPDLRHYVSPCHDGHFDILGMNLAGPPPRPLDEFKTRVVDGILAVELPPFKRSSGTANQ